MATFGDLNSFIGIGRLTRDPELRYTPGGTGVCKFGYRGSSLYQCSNLGETGRKCFTVFKKRQKGSYKRRIKI